VNASHWFGVVALGASLALVGCSKETSANKSAGQGAKMHNVNGTVLAVDASKPSVKIDHEDIPGVMNAMKMTFEVENDKVLEGIKPGDHVRGHLKAEDGKFTIVHLEKH
jgi:protein SCO1/2